MKGTDTKERIEMDARKMCFDEGRGTFNNFLIRAGNIKSSRTLKTIAGLAGSFGVAVKSLNDRAKALNVDINMVNVVTCSYNSALRYIEDAQKEIENA